MCLINNILINLATLLTQPKLNVLSQICKSILCSSGKITMLEISRYTNKSYRTIQRFFKLKFNWLLLNCRLFSSFIYSKDDVFLLACDETVEKKAGKHTNGVAHFFSNLHKSVVPSVAFMTMGIISLNRKKCYPLATQQVIKPLKENTTETQSKAKNKKGDENSQCAKKPSGRPKGSKNKPKEVSKDIQYSILDSLLKLVTTMLISTFGSLPCTYLLLDGYFGNQHYMRLAIGYKLHLISKLKSTASLYLPFSGLYKGHGRPPKYGEKIRTTNIAAKYLVNTVQEENYQYRFYQFTAWSESYIDAMLNVVIISCKNNKTGETSNCVLFSTDLTLSHDKIVEYYRLRFQIEFNFRDAKQYFGLADLKNYKAEQVTTAVNLSFFMCNFSYILIEHFKERFALETVSILDLKAFYRTENIANEVLKLKIKPKKTLQFFNPDQIFELAKKQAVNF